MIQYRVGWLDDGAVEEEMQLSGVAGDTKKSTKCIQSRKRDTC